MIYLVYGALGALTVISLLLLGCFLGWMACRAFDRYRRKSAAQEATSEQRQKMREQQEAFEQMLHYDRDTAYAISAGMTGGGDGR
ncbi:MAG: hypothetical protein IKM11_01470 [Oscillospiraceae bacterium]|nr:hypothetical protein [Oscillospiraceae bacterium]